MRNGSAPRRRPLRQLHGIPGAAAEGVRPHGRRARVPRRGQLGEHPGGLRSDQGHRRTDAGARVRSGVRAIVPRALRSPNVLSIAGLLRPHWMPMTLALVGVAGEAAASLLEPWPLKIVLDYLLQSRPLP